ncbi:uncharacterized protein LOC106087596 [Stomoxys calcitrans]|uniref:Uncharacterized protein n=1 Tax=Stomoxys calcitrans TaxID=35570 RepID=A0A1I8PHU9_STOCA|nr:uncharacterized protein LOC106087596 [Stomoxys calcitrans]
MKSNKPFKVLIFWCVMGLTVASLADTEEKETLGEPTTTTEFNQPLEETTEISETASITETVIETTTDSGGVEESSTPTVITTTPSIPLDTYAVQQMNSVLNHVLRTAHAFVSQVLQESQNSVYPRDKLKTYAENLQKVLNAEDDDDEDNLDDREFYYSIMLKKLNFLKGKSTKNLQTYLPSDWVEPYHKAKHDLLGWLDQASEEMHSQFVTYISDEEDHVKHQYFNEIFDDISRLNHLNQKLSILLDAVKVATNRKTVTFMDLYMS